MVLPVGCLQVGRTNLLLKGLPESPAATVLSFRLPWSWQSDGSVTDKRDHSETQVGEAGSRGLGNPALHPAASGERPLLPARRDGCFFSFPSSGLSFRQLENHRKSL